MPELKVAQLSAGFMLTSIVGFLISIFYVVPQLSLKWGFTLVLFFVLMFIAALISMTYSPAEWPVRGKDDREH